MGIYLNPGNSGFEEIRNSRYVDKSGLISLVNRTIGTKQKLTCVSRRGVLENPLRRRCCAPIMTEAVILPGCLMIWP